MDIMLLLAFTAIFWIPVLILIVFLYTKTSSRRDPQISNTSPAHHRFRPDSSVLMLVLGTIILIGAILIGLKYLLII